jgi:hypothetical protein
MSEKKNEPTITESDLQKSIESLMALLDTEAPGDVDIKEAMEKSMVGTEGGLADRAGAPPLNPELAAGGVEMYEPIPEDEPDLDEMNRMLIAQQLKVTHQESHAMNKSAAKAVEVDEAQDAEEGVEEFAKSLAEAFAAQEELVTAASESEFAKSLVLGTIEGLSVAHEELTKSLYEIESRSDEKIAVLAKGLAAIAKAVGEIRNEIVKVSNAPVRPMAKSVQGVQVLEKSFGGQAPADPALLKSRVVSALEKRVQDGKLDAFQLVKYETTGHLDPALAKDIQSELGL